MTKLSNRVFTGVGMTILVVGLYACEKKEGPMERAGKEIDG